MRKESYFVPLLFCLLAITTSALADDQITIDAASTTTIGEVNPRVFGHNLGKWGQARMFTVSTPSRLVSVTTSAHPAWAATGSSQKYIPLHCLTRTPRCARMNSARALRSRPYLI